MKFNMQFGEELSLEIYGTIAKSDALSHLPSSFHTQLAAQDRVRIRVRLAMIDQFSFKPSPFGFHSFSNAMWYIELPLHGQQQWYLMRYDVNNGMVRKLGNTILNLAMTDAKFYFYEKRKSLISSYTIPSLGGIKCHVDLLHNMDNSSNRDTIHLNKGNVTYTYDCEEGQAAFSRYAFIDIVKDDMSRELFESGVNWDSKGVFMRGKQMKWKRHQETV